MHYVPPVELFDRYYELSEDVLDDGLWHGRLLKVHRDISMEVTGGDEISDYVEIEAVFEAVLELEHVGDLTTAGLLHNLNLCIGFP